MQQRVPCFPFVFCLIGGQESWCSHSCLTCHQNQAVTTAIRSSGASSKWLAIAIFCNGLEQMRSVQLTPHVRTPPSPLARWLKQHDLMFASSLVLGVNLARSCRDFPPRKPSMSATLTSRMTTRRFMSMEENQISKSKVDGGSFQSAHRRCSGAEMFSVCSPFVVTKVLSVSAVVRQCQCAFRRSQKFSSEVRMTHRRHTLRHIFQDLCALVPYGLSGVASCLGRVFLWQMPLRGVEDDGIFCFQGLVIDAQSFH